MTVELVGTPLNRGVAEHARSIPRPADNPFLSLTKLAEERKGSYVRLARGEPDIPTPLHIIDAAKKALDEGQTLYTPPAGIPQLREELSKKFQRDNGLTYSTDEIVVTNGAQESIAVVLQTLLDPGDEVLIASPYYSAYESNIKLAGGVPVPVPTRQETEFDLDPADIRSRITDRSKALAIVNPNNPTGTVLSPERLAQIAQVAIDHDLVVVSDELYEKIRYDGVQHVSIASFPGMRERTVIINGFSKAYSMTGFRVGYFAGPEDFIQSCLEPRHSLSISTPSMSQHAALAALLGPQDHIGELIEEYQLRRDLMAETFDQLGVTYAMPQGGFCFFANIAGAGVDPLEFCERAITDYGLLFHPGRMYGPATLPYIRISFLAARGGVLEGALERFSDLYRSFAG